MSARRKACSASVARANSSCTAVLRWRADPDPLSSLIRCSCLSTSWSVSVATSAGGARERNAADTGSALPELPGKESHDDLHVVDLGRREQGGQRLALGEPGPGGRHQM